MAVIPLMVASAQIGACHDAGRGGSGGGADTASRIERYAANIRTETSAQYNVIYICAAKGVLPDLTEVALRQTLSKTGAPAHANGEWRGSFTALAKDGHPTGGEVSIQTGWDSGLAGELSPDLGFFTIQIEPYPALGSPKAKPDGYFTDQAGHRLPLPVGWLGNSNTSRGIGASLGWAELKAAADRVGDLRFVASTPASSARPYYLLRRSELVAVDAMLKRLQSETAAQARDYRSLCEAVEQRPVVD